MQEVHGTVKPAKWLDGRLSRTGIALATGEDPDTPGGTVLCAASSATKAWIVPPEKAGGFLREHAGCWQACYDAAKLHWDLIRILRANGDKDGEQALWSAARRCRIIDVMLLDQRLRHLAGVHPSPRDLPSLFSEYVPSVSPLERLDGSAADAGNQVCGIWLLYEKMNLAARQIIKAVRIPKHWVRKYGPMAIGIDVQGSIALGQAERRGIRVVPHRADEAYRGLDEKIASCSARLHQDQHARHHFRWEGKRVMVNEAGPLPSNTGTPEKWVRHLLSERIVFEHNVRQVPPYEDDGQISLDPEKWSELVRCQPLLRAYIDLTRAARLQSWFSSLQGPWIARPKFRVVPQIGSSFPNLAALKAFRARIFAPRPGHSFVVVTLQDLELRCWGLICEGHGTESKLAHYFRYQDDPIASIATELFQRRRKKNLADLNDPVQLKRWKKLTRTILRAVAHGITPQHIPEWMKRNGFTNMASTEEKAIKLRSLLCKVCREANRFLHDRTLEVIERRLRIDEIELLKKVVDLARTIRGRDVWDQIDVAPAQLRKALDGDPSHSKLLEYLADAGATGNSNLVLDQVKQNQGLFQLLAEFPITPAGRIGGYQVGVYRYVAEMIDLADEVRKRVAFELAASGYELVAQAGNQFIVEMESLRREDRPAVIKAIRRLVGATISGVIGRVGRRCCCCRIADQW